MSIVSNDGLTEAPKTFLKPPQSAAIISDIEEDFYLI